MISSVRDKDSAPNMGIMHQKLQLHTKFPTYVYTIHNFNWLKPTSVSQSCVSTSDEMFASCMKLNKAAEKFTFKVFRWTVGQNKKPTPVHWSGTGEAGRWRDPHQAVSGISKCLFE